MANLKRGEVDIFIGGTERRLKFNFNALCELEKLFGRPVQDIFTKGNVGMLVIRDSLFVGLKNSKPDLNPEEVGYWLENDIDKLGEFTEALTASLFAALGSVMPSGDADPTPPPTVETEKTPASSGDSITSDS